MKNTKIRTAAAGILAAVFFLGVLIFGPSMEGSDHADTPSLTAIPRHDARITDLYAFIEGDDLVVALCVDPTVPPQASSYAFLPDVMYEINIDNSSVVSYDDSEANSRYGGTVEEPNKIRADIAFRITFEGGVPRLRTRGLRGSADQPELFAGLRDDPFIRTPRTGRNVAAMVVRIPLSDVLGERPELLIWAYSRVPELDKPQADHAGMALRSMFPENMPMNEMNPRHHAQRMGKAPDVVILNTQLPVGFPNGRLLTDDVVDLVGDIRLFPSEAPDFPVVNDVPFLTDFPYLAPPHPAP